MVRDFRVFHHLYIPTFWYRFDSKMCVAVGELPLSAYFSFIITFNNLQLNDINIGIFASIVVLRLQRAVLNDGKAEKGMRG